MLTMLVFALSLIFYCVEQTTPNSLGDMVSALNPTTAPTTGASPPPVGYKVSHFYKGESANVSLLIEKLLHGYDQRLRPNYKGKPVKVGITMHVSSISSISEVNMDFTLDFYFRQYWHDERLTFSEEEDELCISNEMLSKLWWPDTFFANAKQERFHEATTKNAFLRISPSGWISQSLRLTVTASCSMDLKLFPMDSQICPLEIESYAYSDKHIYYWWKEGKITYNKEMQLPQFEIKGYNVTIKSENLSTGNYSRLAARLFFERRLGYYLIQIYLPSTLIVVLSWVSFWLDRTAVPARVSLGITTVLTMTTLISSTNASLPKISYLKSIDIYLVTCFCMVFSALLEFAAVSYLGNRKWKTRPPVIIAGPIQTPNLLLAHQIHASSDTQLTSSTSFENQQLSKRVYGRFPAARLHINSNFPFSEVAQNQKKRTTCEVDNETLWKPHSSSTGLQSAPSNSRVLSSMKAVLSTSPPAGSNPNVMHANAIDRYSRLVFPIVFVVFSCIYWVVYTNASPNLNLDGFIIG